MTENRRRRTTLFVLLLLLLLILLLVLRCSCKEPAPVRSPEPAATAPAAAESPAPAPAASEPDEVLTAATLTAPERVTAGTAFTVAWTGPDNPGDYVTIVRADAAPSEYGHYLETEKGPALELTAPIEPGKHEVRYITARSHTVLGRAAIEVVAAGATLDAPAEVVLGAQVSVAWTGPDNPGDYVTLVPKETPDGQYGNYTTTDKGSPLTVTAPTAAGDAELRYMTGQGNKVLARRAIRVVAAEVSLDAPAEAVAGTTIQVTWTGPANPGDYVTVVASGTPDGQYGNYTDVSKGSPLPLLLPILDGAAEIRYATGQGGKVLARRPLRIVAAEVSLSAPDQAAAGAALSVTWTGPNNPGDYVTIVASGTPDGQYGDYTLTTEGSPLSVNAPKTAGAAEVRYMTGQGSKVLARRAIQVVP